MSWTKPRASQDIPFVSKDVIEREVKGNLDYLKDAVDDNVTDIAANLAKFDDVSHAEPTRAKDNIYQNSTKIRFISIQIALNDTEQAKLLIGSATPPTTVIYDMTAPNDQYVTFAAIIPPSYYYEVEETSGTISIGEWHEWDLF